MFNKTSIKNISIDEIINELENDGTVDNNQRSISCESKDKIDQFINFNQNIKPLEGIAKQNKKLNDLFNKLSDDKINITKTKKYTWKQNSLRGSNERKQTKEKKLQRNWMLNL